MQIEESKESENMEANVLRRFIKIFYLINFY